MNEADRRALSEGSDGASAGPGWRLAAARQAQGLTPADVARQLKLSVWQVEALEAGDFQRLPGPIFVRGFIRNYARLVRIDPDELVRAAAGHLPQAAAQPASPPSQDIPFPAPRARHWPIVAAAMAVVIAALAAYEFYWNEPLPAQPPAAAVAPTAAGVRPARDAEPSPTAPVQSTPPAAGGTEAAQPVVVAAAEPVSVEASATAPSDAETARQRKAGERQVKLVFEEESWVEIRDRNERVIFSQLNRPGTRQIVNGLPPFSIVVGNAHGVRLEYEDQAVDLARHTRIDVARLILQ